MSQLVHGIRCIVNIVELLLRNCCLVEQQWELGSLCVGTDSVTTLAGWEHVSGIKPVQSFS